MINIGICGYGTVGKSVIDHITEYKSEIMINLGTDFDLTHVADRSIHSKQLDYRGITKSKDPMELADNPDISIILELIGGTSIAYELIKRAINNNKHVITANKALIAEHGDELFKLAKTNKVYFGFEASVAGAIPIINTIAYSMSNESIFSITGIINGTCNYILHEMTSNELDFSSALSKAQELGYAESDPKFDIEGIDAAHKISILSSIAYKIPLPFKNVSTEGIKEITLMDIKYANELGYSIKHVGITKKDPKGLECRVHPVLVNKNNIFSKVDGVMNAIFVNSDKMGKSMLYGQGAGGEATASAVISNLTECLNYIHNINTTNLNLSGSIGTHNAEIKDIGSISSSFYLRMYAEDVPGVMAEITNILAAEDISIEAVTQHEPTELDSLIPIVMITNCVKGALIMKAIDKIESLKQVKDNVYSIRVLQVDEK